MELLLMMGCLPVSVDVKKLFQLPVVPTFDPMTLALAAGRPKLLRAWLKMPLINPPNGLLLSNCLPSPDGGWPAGRAKADNNGNALLPAIVSPALIVAKQKKNQVDTIQEKYNKFKNKRKRKIFLNVAFNPIKKKK